MGNITHMLTAGVDLAAESKGTALAVIEWLPTSAVVRELSLGVEDQPIIEAASRVNKIGIDCALGWPQEFIDFINAQADPHNHTVFDGGMDWRRRLAYRETDRHVRETSGRWPLSVSTDRLGLTAMRAAGLLSKMAQAGISLDRSGQGKVAEVYPGATLRMWGFATQGYRASAQIRESLVATLQESEPWFTLGEHVELMISSCDAFDAIIAALATRAVATGRYLPPNPSQLALARQEGWIALPQGSLSCLVDPAG